MTSTPDEIPPDVLIAHPDECRTLDGVVGVEDVLLLEPVCEARDQRPEQSDDRVAQPILIVGEAESVLQERLDLLFGQIQPQHGSMIEIVPAEFCKATLHYSVPEFPFGDAELDVALENVDTAIVTPVRSLASHEESMVEHRRPAIHGHVPLSFADQPVQRFGRPDQPDSTGGIISLKEFLDVRVHSDERSGQKELLSRLCSIRVRNLKFQT